MPIIKPYDTGWKQIKLFLYDVTMEIGEYNSAWWMNTIITCTLCPAPFMAAITLHAIPITIALCKLMTHLFVYAIQEAPYWLVSNTFGRMSDNLPHQGPKRQRDLRSDGKFKRKRNAGGEKTALYFRWKRFFSKMQYHHCNGKPKRRRYKSRSVVTKESQKKTRKKQKTQQRHRRQRKSKKEQTKKHKRRKVSSNSPLRHEEVLSGQLKETKKGSTPTVECENKRYSSTNPTNVDIDDHGFEPASASYRETRFTMNFLSQK